jgi:hypothetical protein
MMCTVRWSPSRSCARACSVCVFRRRNAKSIWCHVIVRCKVTIESYPRSRRTTLARTSGRRKTRRSEGQFECIMPDKAFISELYRLCPEKILITPTWSGAWHVPWRGQRAGLGHRLLDLCARSAKPHRAAGALRAAVDPGLPLHVDPSEQELPVGDALRQAQLGTELHRWRWELYRRRALGAWARRGGVS